MAPGQSYRKTSAALREQIAKARAAKRVASQPVSAADPVLASEPSLVPTDDTFDFGLSNDPFNQHKDDKSQARILQGRLETARTSGRLNIAAMGLKEIPAEVMDMYNLESIGKPGAAWAESVDLTRFVAADNELEMISDSVFPDVDPMEEPEDEDSPGNIFAGLETLDLHGNMLISLPTGLRRLQVLTSLNLVSHMYHIGFYILLLFADIVSSPKTDWQTTAWRCYPRSSRFETLSSAATYSTDRSTHASLSWKALKYWICMETTSRRCRPTSVTSNAFGF